MNDLTEYGKNEILKKTLIERQVYCGLINENEITNNDYSRVLIKFEDPKNGQVYNKEEIEFPVATSNWGEIKKIAIYDSKTSGNKLWESRTEVVKNVGEASQYKIPKGYLILRLR